MGPSLAGEPWALLWRRSTISSAPPPFSPPTYLQGKFAAIHHQLSSAQLTSTGTAAEARGASGPLPVPGMAPVKTAGGAESPQRPRVPLGDHRQ